MSDSAAWRQLRTDLKLPDIPDDLLRQAFQHGSYVREHHLEPLATNQRLEFLGDAVLDLVVAEELYRLYPERPEGALTRRKAALVRTESLAIVAGELGLGSYMLLGRGEEDSGGRHKPSLLAECFEALIGAVYLSAGLEAARDLVLAHLPMKAAAGPAGIVDHKSALQELLQSRLRCLPEYTITATDGPAHALTFTVEVRLERRVLGSGTGHSKREAAQKAAAEALATSDEWLPGFMPD